MSTDRTSGSPTWIDLSTPDLESAKKFYGGLFDWTFTDQGDDFGNYHMIEKDGQSIGGAMAVGPEEQMPPSWTVYLKTDDIAATTKKATEANGVIFVEPMDVGPLGKMAVLADPAGAVLGLWQATEFSGFDLTYSPGTPVWFEAMSTKFDAAMPFYRDALDWDIAWMGGEGGEGGVRYLTHGENEKATAGLCDAASMFSQSLWRTYFGVADCEASIAKVTELGGKVTDGPEDTPFGRIATVVDPSGATFQLNQAPEGQQG